VLKICWHSDIGLKYLAISDEQNANLPLLSFTNAPLTAGEITECINSLQKKCTPDVNGISVDFVSNFALTLSKPLQHIFSLSLSTGVVPAQLKVAKVIPVFKSGDRSIMDNYRPFSLLNTFCKILRGLSIID
jgi:hypothetical protein